MSNELQLAKEMFLKYNGSHFFMAHQDDYERYKSFNVSKEQELLWIDEYLNDLLNEISGGIEDIESVVSKISIMLSIVRSFKKVDIVIRLLDKLRHLEHQLDSFSKMVIAEDILETVRSLKYNKELIKNTIVINLQDFAVNMFQTIINNPITVNSTYINRGYLKDEVKESRIIERVQRSLEEWYK